MGLASKPVASVMRLAARPVGAHSMSLTPLAARTRRMALTMVVLPTPGPPVITSAFDVSASRIAATWLLARASPMRPSTHGSAFCGSIQGQGSVPLASRSNRSAMVRSARCRPARNTQAVCPTVSAMTVPSATSRSIAVRTKSRGTCPFRDDRDSSASSENRQWIERRSCSFFDAQRRSSEQKLETIKPPRLLDRSLEIEIVENVYAHRDQRQSMQRIWDSCRQTCGRDVVWPVASDEGNATLFQEIRNVGVISCEPGFPWPRAERCAPLPAPRIEKDDVACRHRHVLQLFKGLEVFPMDRRSRLHPPLSSGLSRQECGIEQNGSRDNAVLQSVDASFRATARGGDVL